MYLALMSKAPKLSKSFLDLGGFDDLDTMYQYLKYLEGAIGLLR